MTAIKAFCNHHPQSAFWIAAILTLLLVVLVLAIAMEIVIREKGATKTAGRSDTHLWFVKPFVWLKALVLWLWNSPRALPRLIIEPDTNSYSLSKLQFMLWTAA